MSLITKHKVRTLHVRYGTYRIVKQPSRSRACAKSPESWMFACTDYEVGES